MAEYTDYQRTQIAKEEYSNYKINENVKIYKTLEDEKNKVKNKKSIGKVAKVNNNMLNGGQSYIIVDNIDVPKEKVKQVKVLYRGSENPGKLKDNIKNKNIKSVPIILEDVIVDWGYNDFKAAKDITTKQITNLDFISNHVQTVPKQFLYSSDVLQKTLKEYPNAEVEVYGHSLGSMNGQYAMANIKEKDMNRVSAYLYEGPNIYSYLTKGQRETVNKLAAKNKIKNYVDTKDLVPLGYKNRLAVGKVYWLDTKRKNIFAQHNLEGYKYDENGNLLIKNEKLSYEMFSVYDGINEVKKELKILKKIKNKLKNNGNLTKSHKIYLEANEALAVVKGFQQTVDDNLEELKNKYDKWASEAEKDWNKIIKKARQVNDIGTKEVKLTDTEIIETLKSVGCTKKKIHTDVEDKYEKKKKKLEIIQGEIRELVKK